MHHSDHDAHRDLSNTPRRRARSRPVKRRIYFRDLRLLWVTLVFVAAWPWLCDLIDWLNT